MGDFCLTCGMPKGNDSHCGCNRQHAVDERYMCCAVNPNESKLSIAEQCRVVDNIFDENVLLNKRIAELEAEVDRLKQLEACTIWSEHLQEYRLVLRKDAEAAGLQIEEVQG